MAVSALPLTFERGIKMRCAACDCRENESGYCGCASYVCIDENGHCDSYYVPSEEAKEEVD